MKEIASDPQTWASLLTLDRRFFRFLKQYEDVFVTEIFPVAHPLDRELGLWRSPTYTAYFALRKDRDLLAAITADENAIPPTMRDRHRLSFRFRDAWNS